MGFRQFVKARATELSAAQAATLGNAPVSPSTIQPTKPSGLNVVGLMLKISATVTQSAAAAWNVGQLIKELKFAKGSDVLLDINGEDQYEKVFHILTGLPIGATFNAGGPTYFSNGSSAGAIGNSSALHQVYIPLQFVTMGLPLTITLTNNAYTAVTNATAGTVTFQVEFFYSDLPVNDDRMKIVVAPTALNATTDINIALQFSENKPVDEVWVELSADAALTYETFSIGQSVIYDQVDGITLQVQEAPFDYLYHIAGFFKQLIKRGTVFPTQGTQQNAPKLVNNYASAQTPTFYLVLSTGGTGVSASAPAGRRQAGA